MTEMIKLVEMLAINKVPFQVVNQQEFDTIQVFIPNFIKPVFDVVCNKYSDGNKSGLLEIYSDIDKKHTGFLTAKDVYNMVRID